MTDLDLIFDPLPPDSLRRFVVDSLNTHNIAKTGQCEWHPVGFFLRNARGEWVGGLFGDLWGGWLQVRILWVDMAVRGHGHGARLLQAAEAYAAERGCFPATLETHSFQARPFYEKLGYEVFATLEDYPPGHSKFFLRKPLPARVPEPARKLIDFWFGPEGDPDREAHRAIWFKSTGEFDGAIRREFIADYERAAGGELGSWEMSAQGALALLLLLDQVPRNIFRDTPLAYATDATARAVAGRAIDRGFDKLVPHIWRRFFYMPFHHSEDLADQRRSVALFGSLPQDPDRRGALRRYGRPYVEVIERFGRFPHRNEILGRVSTPDEIAFLAERGRHRQTS